MEGNEIKLNGRKSSGYYKILTIIFAVLDVVFELLYSYAVISTTATVFIVLFLYIFKFAFLYCLIKFVIWKCIDDYHKKEIVTLQNHIENLEKKYETALQRLTYLEDKINKINDNL